MDGLTAISVFISLVLILAVTGLVKAVNWVWLRPRKQERWLRQQGMRGTSYKFMFGDMKDHASMLSKAMASPMTGFSNDYFSRIEPLRKQLDTKFGKEYFFWSGPAPTISISKPELIREALSRMNEFIKPRLNPIADKLFPGFISYEGEKWSKHRRLVNPAFHMEKLKIMLPAFHDSCAEMINKWEKAIAKTSSNELDVWPYLTALSADVISRAAFGSSYEEGQRLFELLREQSDLGLQMLRSIYIPGLKYVPTARNRRFRELEGQIQTSLKQIVVKRKEAMEAGDEGTNDLLSILMHSNLKEIQQAQVDNKNKRGFGMSLQEVIEECKLFYIAGQETTSALLVWTLILLSKHQDWQERARQEVIQTFGDSKPDFERLNYLKTVTMILNEVLRLYPPVTQHARWISKDTKLGELTLPAESLISFPMLFLYRDKEVWGSDADEFKPERFAEGIVKATKGHNSFFPFGWGPRVCIGEKFAMTEVKMALSMILPRFSFELSPSYAHAPMTIIFLQPQHGAHMILHKRY